MRPISCLGLTALLALAGVSGPARADVFVRLPFLQVVVRQQPRVVAPPAPLLQPSAPAIVPGNPPPVPIVPQTTPAPAVVPSAPAVAVLTPAQFASAFRPQPGNYEVMLLHPFTGCPVKVCFSLPPGCPRKVRVHRRELEFVYPHHQTVSIRFYRNGTVRVRN